MKKVIVIGAGIGGLCVAIRLLNKGYNVTILEKEDTIGGKVNIKTKEGARFDLTASVLMTPESYINIFSEVGKNYKDYFEMIKIDPIYKVNHYDKKSYKFYSELGKMVDELEKIEENFFFVKGYNKRFFTVEDAERFFSIVGKPKVKEEDMARFNQPKKVIEVQVEKE